MIDSPFHLLVLAEVFSSWQTQLLLAIAIASGTAGLVLRGYER